MRISLPLLPQVTAREARPFGEHGEFCPDYRRVEEAMKFALGGNHDENNTQTANELIGFQPEGI